jgi:hypothetical protein
MRHPNNYQLNKISFFESRCLFFLLFVCVETKTQGNKTFFRIIWAVVPTGQKGRHGTTHIIVGHAMDQPLRPWRASARPDGSSCLISHIVKQAMSGGPNV